MTRKQKLYLGFLSSTTILLFLIVFSYMILIATVQSSFPMRYEYMSKEEEGTLSIINKDTNEATVTTEIENNPYRVTVSHPEESKAYMTSYGDNAIDVVGTETSAVIAVMPAETGHSSLDQFIINSSLPSVLGVKKHETSSNNSSEVSWKTDSELPTLATTVDLKSSGRVCLRRHPVTFTATVTTMSQGTEKPSGTITFMDGTKWIGTSNVSSGQANLTTSSLSVGLHSITAEYSGDSNFNSSKSSVFIISILIFCNATIHPFPGDFEPSSTIEEPGFNDCTIIIDTSKNSQSILEHPIVTAIIGIFTAVIADIIVTKIKKN